MRHVYLAGELGSDCYGFSSNTVSEALDSAAEAQEDVTFHVNSPGGDVGDAVMIDAMFRAFAQQNPNLTATVEVDGYAASAASFAFLSAGRIVAHPSALFMIHDPSSWAWGKAEELRKTADVLDKCRDAIVAAYVRRTGRYEDEIRRAMADEMWFTADEAISWGLADELLEAKTMHAAAESERVAMTADTDNKGVFDASGLRSISKNGTSCPVDEVGTACHNTTTNRRDSEQMIVDDEHSELAKAEVEATEESAGEAPAYRVIAGHVYQIAPKESESNA